MVSYTLFSLEGSLHSIHGLEVVSSLYWRLTVAASSALRVAQSSPLSNTLTLHCAVLAAAAADH